MRDHLQKGRQIPPERACQKLRILPGDERGRAFFPEAAAAFCMPVPEVSACLLYTSDLRELRLDARTVELQIRCVDRSADLSPRARQLAVRVHLEFVLDGKPARA